MYHHSHFSAPIAHHAVHHAAPLVHAAPYEEIPHDYQVCPSPPPNIALVTILFYAFSDAQFDHIPHIEFG